MLERSPRGDVRRAADYFKLIRYSFSGGGKSFAGRSCDLRRFFYLIWECSRRLASVVIENKDFESLIQQYDRENAFFYCDPPYFEAESCYAVEFPKEDHRRLHDVLLKCKGYVMVSYNCCPYILELYQEFYRGTQLIGIRLKLQKLSRSGNHVQCLCNTGSQVRDLKPELDFLIL